MDKGLSQNKVACLGIAVADIVARPVESLPEKGKLECIQNVELHTGGCAVNTGLALGKLGVPVSLFAKLGKDWFGKFVLKKVEEGGLETKGIKFTSDINTSITLVFVSSDGERSFLHYLGANGQFYLKDIDFSLLSECKILHVAGSFLLPALDGEPTAKLLKKAKEMGLTTSVDTAWDASGKWLKAIESVFPYLDIFLPSIEEARMISGRKEPLEIASFFLEKGVKVVGLKMGKDGSYLKTEKEEYFFPPYSVKVVDATGAGDAYVAGFLAGLVRKWSWKKIGQLANATGAICTTGIGASAGIKNWEETLRFANLS